MTTTPMAAPNLSRQELIKYATAKYVTKQVWRYGETVWLAPDAYLKNIGSRITLTKVTDKHDCKNRRYDDFGTVFKLINGYWQFVQQPTARQVLGKLDTATALPAQYSRGKAKLFKV